MENLYKHRMYNGIGILVWCIFSALFPCEKNIIFWIALISTITSILMQIVNIELIFKSEVDVVPEVPFFNCDVLKLGYTAIGLQLFVAVVLMFTVEEFSFELAIIIEIIVLLFSAVGIITSDVSKVETETEILENIVSEMELDFIEDINKRINEISSENKLGEFEVIFECMRDLIKYADRIEKKELKEIENKIYIIVIEIKKAVNVGDIEDVLLKSQLFSKLIEERNIKSRMLKYNHKVDFM